MVEAIVLMRFEESKCPAHMVLWVTPVHTRANLELVDDLRQKHAPSCCTALRWG